MRFAHAAAIAAVALAAGCAAIDRQEAADSEQLLEQAGFHTVPADTAAREEGLKEVRPRQIFARSHNGTKDYVFADPDNCRCFYVGGEKEYAQLQELRKARIAEHAQNLRAWNPMSNSPAPDVWGPWKPEGLVAK